MTFIVRRLIGSQSDAVGQLHEVRLLAPEGVAVEPPLVRHPTEEFPERVPRQLGEAEPSQRVGGQKEVAGGVFDDDFIDSYIELKMAEIIRFEHTPHPVEFEMYYSA